MVLSQFSVQKYTAPSCTLIRLDNEADICTGTNQAGHNYNDDNPLDELDD